MADTKITALTAISTVDPAVDVLPIVDVSDTTMAASGTTKKITSNQILGAGGTATLASATITGDLTVDTSTLKVDSANNRVGIKTATPTAALQIASGNVRVDDGYQFEFGGSTNGISGSNASNNLSFYTNNTIAYSIGSAGGGTWYVSGSTAMTLNSTGLGVGASPVVPLHIYSGGTGTTDFGNVVATFRTGASGRAVALQFSDTSNIANIGMLSGALQFAAGGSTKQMTLDTSGNVGVGVTPSAWGSNSKALQVGGGSASVSSTGAGSTASRFAHCAYFDNTNWLYQYTGVGPALYQVTGANAGSTHAWYIAPGGTAGNAITFTQAMTLDASGNLLVGTTSGSFGSRLIISADSGTTSWATGPLAAAPLNYYITANNTQGVFLNGTSATAWTAISDERFKDIIEPITNAVSKVGSLRSVIGKFKTDAEGTRRSFLIAQDVLAAFPEAAVANNPDKLGVTYTEVIPLLVAAIKELTARVEALEA
jgi:hypothetical protein